METHTVTNDLEEEERYTESTHRCVSCGDAILRTDEVFLLRIVVAALTEEGRPGYVDAQDQQGDYLYEPLFFDFCCWESEIEELHELEPVPPIVEPNALFECKECESSILQGELFGLVGWGEIRRSKREPNGLAGEVFEELDQRPLVVCVSCLKRLNDEVNELWDGDIAQDDECIQGTHARCWRYGCADEDCEMPCPKGL